MKYSKDMDISGYQLTNLEDIGFHLEYLGLNMAAVFQYGKHIPFSPSIFNNFQMILLAENRIFFNYEKDDENSPSTTPVCERPNQPPALLQNHSSGTTKKMLLLMFTEC